VAQKSVAAVLTGERAVELREFPLPEVGRDDGLIRVEATGICGADWGWYSGRRPTGGRQMILGHEIVGRVERIGPDAAKRLGLREGDRVLLEEAIPCGHCRLCRTGRYRMCEYKRYGEMSIEIPPALYGGYSQYIYLDPRAVVYKMAPSVPVDLAPLFIPISNGIRWVQQDGGAGIGSTVLVQGPGQHGLGCVIGAREAGARTIVVTGTDRDTTRLAIARELGATHTIDVTAEDPVERVREITDGEMADVVVDAADAPATVALAPALTRIGGTIILAGSKRGTPVDRFLSDQIFMRELTVKGMYGHDLRSVEPAIWLIESGKYPLHKLSTHTFPLDQIDLALRTVGREGDPEAIHVTIVND
jgi:threonine dehydrogenase-like Zn-dependent dehydrogenase